VVAVPALKIIGRYRSSPNLKIKKNKTVYYNKKIENVIKNIKGKFRKEWS